MTDRERLEQAVGQFLRAAGLDESHPDLVGTPRRVAELWAREFLGAGGADPAEVLAETVQGEGPNELVVVRGLPFHGMCPHHLLPFVGTATVAYLPQGKLVGFGRLADLVRGCTQRLTLQERACNDVVDALMVHLGAAGAGCVMRAEHMCLRIPDDKHDATVETVSLRGSFRDRPELVGRLLQ